MENNKNQLSKISMLGKEYLQIIGNLEVEVEKFKGFVNSEEGQKEV